MRLRKEIDRGAARTGQEDDMKGTRSLDPPASRAWALAQTARSRRWTMRPADALTEMFA
jgi:hypothetical protein